MRAGFERSPRKQSFEEDVVYNTIVSVGVCICFKPAAANLYKNPSLKSERKIRSIRLTKRILYLAIAGLADHLFGAGNVERPSRRLIDFSTYMHHFGIFLFFRFRNAIGFCSEVIKLSRERKGAVSCIIGMCCLYLLLFWWVGCTQCQYSRSRERPSSVN